jgi:hypothetical protein
MCQNFVPAALIISKPERKKATPIFVASAPATQHNTKTIQQQQQQQQQ